MPNTRIRPADAWRKPGAWRNSCVPRRRMCTESGLARGRANQRFCHSCGCRSTHAAESTGSVLNSRLRQGEQFVSPLVVSWLPRLVRIVEFHAFDDAERRRPEVLLIHHSVIAHHKSLYACDQIVCRYGYKGEPPDHRVTHHVVQLAQKCIRTLALQNL